MALFFLPKFASNKLHLISALQFGKGKISSLNLDQSKLMKSYSKIIVKNCIILMIKQHVIKVPFQPSYCKILNDLKEADTSESEDREV